MYSEPRFSDPFNRFLEEQPDVQHGPNKRAEAQVWQTVERESQYLTYDTHAKVQLFLHYKLHSELRRPRVICFQFGLLKFMQTSI